MRGRPVKIGWLSSGRDPAARTLLSEVVRRARRDAIELDIGVVFCDRERGEDPESDAFLDLVADLGLPSAVLSSAASWQAWRARHDRDDRRFANRAALREAWREAFHDEVGRLLDPYRLDLLVLAGYMLIMSPDLCARFATLNLHPALPSGPQGTWQQVIWQLLADEADETGAMVHLATAELDRGPVVAYCSFPIVGLRWDRLWHAFRRQRDALGLEALAATQGERQPLFAEIRRQGERREIPLLYHAVREFAEEHLVVRAGEVVGVTVQPPLALHARRRSRADGRRARRRRRRRRACRGRLMTSPPRLFVTDCEGPLTRNDNAMEVTAAFVPDGAELFARLSRYDDFLADVVHKPGYNAGDTLRLIVPFLLAYGVGDRDVEEYSADTVLVVPGARDLLRDVSAALPSYIISTSYSPYVRALCRGTGFPFAQCRCTKLELDAWHLNGDEAGWLRDRAEAILAQPVIELPEAARSAADLSAADRAAVASSTACSGSRWAPRAGAARTSSPPCVQWAAASSSARCARSRPAGAPPWPT